MSFIDEVKTGLEEDEMLSALMTGGIYSGTQIREISRQNTPTAFIEKEIQPCMLVAVNTDVKVAPHHRGLITTFSTYFYQRVGYDVITYAMERTFDLLHEAKIGEGTWQILFSTSIENQLDIALDCSLSSQRWMAYRLKPEYQAEGSGS